MITRIELINFMSHAHTVIEPAAGLTVLIGPNNIGKSAVVAALQILCHNDKSTYVTRHGEKECSVIVHTDDGHVIQWSRKNSPAYTIDGKRFDRLRQGNVPGELHEALRLPRIDAGNDADFDVHFGSQKDPIFLLRDSGANAARFFASSSDADRLVAMQKRHKDKHQEAKREKKRLEQLSGELNRELELLQPVVEIQQRLDEVESTYEALGALQQSIAAARELAQRVRHTSWEREREVARIATLQRLPIPPRLEATEPLARLVNEFPRAERDCARLGAERTTLQNLASAPIPEDAGSLGETIRQMDHARREVEALQARAAVLSSLQTTPQFQETESLRRLLADCRSHDRELRKCEEVTSKFSDLQRLPIPQETQELRVDVMAWAEAQTDVSSARAAVQVAEQELAAVVAQLREELAGRECPTCGSPIDPEMFLEHVAGMAGGHHA